VRRGVKSGKINRWNPAPAASYLLYPEDRMNDDQGGAERKGKGDSRDVFLRHPSAARQPRKILSAGGAENARENWSQRNRAQS